MNLEWYRFPATFGLEFSYGFPSIILFAVYLALTGWFLWKYRAEFSRLGRQQWIIFTLTLVLLIPANMVLSLARSSFISSASTATLSFAFFIPLIATLLVAALAAWLGPLPGIVAGLVSGIIWAGFYHMPVNDLFAFVVWGGMTGALLHQSFKDGPFVALRHPILAFPLVSLLTVTLLLLINRLVIYLASLPQGNLVLIENLLSLLSNELLLWFIIGIAHGLLIELLFFVNPRFKPAQRVATVSIYGRSLRVRFVFTIIPVVLLSMVFSIVAVASRAVSLAREQSLVEMGRSASNASDGILHFYYTGLNLIATFADDVELLSENPDVRGAILEKDRQIVAFFQELLLTDATGQVITAVPQKTTAISLTTEEKIAVDLALDVQISQFTHLTVLPSGEYGLTVVWPVIRDGISETQGVLMGRVQLDVNPEMRRALEALQYSRTQTSDDALVSQSYGFILDNRSLIVAHPDEGAILRPFEIPQALEWYTVEGAAGSAYDGIGPGGEQVLFYSEAVEGTPYTVVLQLPFSEVLETATLISSPILWIQLLAGVILLAIIPFLATQITKPLNILAEGAHQISQGNLDIPVKISREDEVAQLGGAFEQMRLRLKDRLNDLSLLLDVSQKVSATLDLEQGVPPILEGALKETGAVVARFVIIHAERPTRVLSVGLDDSEFRELDKAFTSVLVRRRTEPLISEDLSKSGSGPVPRSLRSIAAFPVRTQNRTVAILWVGGASPNAFDSASVNFLSTLASQAAVLVDNARLFQAAEGERRRLAAILSSTIDAILVTDRDNQLLLVNPALQNLLDIDDNAYGVPVNKLEIPESLAAALIRDEGETDASSVIEIPMLDGRTFYASIAPIMDAGGSSIGQVVVMRDITHFKELDEMKSDFVETVSHDLRRPLTSIQGYATMLMMVGELNDQQQKYIDHILDGSNRMRELIEDLLNLGRIEAGLGLLQEPCRLGLMLIEVVNSMAARATAKGLELHLEPSEGAPTVIGDCTLLRQAISNLVDNAIKYTPAGGQINVGLEMRDNETLIYIADTGIGIAHEDQIRLFEKFYRIKRRETSEIPGTGLGLALVRSIVERHNGRVWVESELNQGTTFYIVLPFVDEDDA